MQAPARTLRALTAGLSLAAALPVLAQDYGSPPSAPPPPEQLPWAAPQQAPPPPRSTRPPPVYRPDYAYDGQPGAPTYPAYPPYPPRAPPPALPPPPLAPPAPPPAVRVWTPQVELAFRAGVASPGGTAVEGLPMADLFADQLALGVELGLRTTPHLYVGLFAEGGFGDAGRAAAGAGCAGVACDSSAVSGRFGLQLRYHLAPYAGLDPWLGYGVAVSGATVSGTDATGTYSRTLQGVEYARLSAGIDLKLSRSAAIGLYAEWTSGVFTQLLDRENGQVVASADLAGSSSYSWFTAGPRIRF